MIFSQIVSSDEQESLTRGPCVMKGYFCNEEATQQAQGEVLEETRPELLAVSGRDIYLASNSSIYRAQFSGQDGVN